MSQTIACPTLLKRSVPIAALAVGCFVLPSEAYTFSYSGDTTGGPTFNRLLTQGFESDNNPLLVPLQSLSPNGTDVPYFVQSFVVPTAGPYNITGSQDFLAIQFLYEISFDPTTPSANVLSGDDPFPDEGNSGFLNLSLTANRQYFLVTTGFDDSSNSFGTFRNTITAVPEPSAIGGAVFFGIGCLILKRKLKVRKSLK